jgi:tetratricopeptide (TPR) repeat protein
VLNTEKDLWGANGYKPEKDVLSFKVRPSEAPHQEWMSFDFEDLTTNSGKLVLRWEKLAIPMTIEVDAVNQALANARIAIAEAKPDDWRTLYRSADFSFNAGVNHDEAMKWATESLAREENFLNLNLMARMKAKAGDTKAAIKHAEKAIQAGKKAKDPFDTRPTEKLLAEWKGKK